MLNYYHLDMTKESIKTLRNIDGERYDQAQKFLGRKPDVHIYLGGGEISSSYMIFALLRKLFKKMYVYGVASAGAVPFFLWPKEDVYFYEYGSFFVHPLRMQVYKDYDIQLHDVKGHIATFQADEANYTDILVKAQISQDLFDTIKKAENGGGDIQLNHNDLRDSGYKIFTTSPDKGEAIVRVPF